MQGFNLVGKLYNLDDISSDVSEHSLIYISSGEEDPSGDCESDYSKDTEEMAAPIENEVASSPIMISGKIVTTGSLEEEMDTGPRHHCRDR